jgi:hypothetical protein
VQLASSSCAAAITFLASLKAEAWISDIVEFAQ